MEYQLALPPDLGLDPDDIVSAWNAAPERRALAEVRLAPSAGVAAFDPFLLAGAITVISTVATGVLTNVLSEQIKQLLAKKGSHAHTEIVEVELPDGKRLLVVRTEEE
jgi:hypothetical protein